MTAPGNVATEKHSPELRGLFVVGTDTGVGKTFVATAIVRALRAQGVHVGAYKPVVSGCETGGDESPVWSDIALLDEATGHQFPDDRIGPQRFRAPLAPPVAARLEGRAVDRKLLRAGFDWWRGQVDSIIVEGAGGLLSPIAEGETVADLAGDLGLPVLIVSRLGLGAINQTLLTVEAAQRRKLKLAGILINDCDDCADSLAGETNPGLLAEYCSVPILAVWPHCRPEALLQMPDFRTMNWVALMQPCRQSL